MLRLHTETDAKIVSRVHHPIHTYPTHSLHGLGKELSPPVSTIAHTSPSLAHFTSIDSCLERMKTAGQN